MLALQSHLAALSFSGTPIAFKADSSTMDRLFDKEVPLVEDWMDAVTERCKLAFAAALVEWVARRFEGSSAEADLLDFAESLYAASVDVRYALDVDLPEPTGGDPVGYIVYATHVEATAVLRTGQKLRSDPTLCANLALIVRHVLPKPQHGGFKDWLKLVLDRRLGPACLVDEDNKDPEVQLGVPVPREAFDPSQAFEPSAWAMQVATFVRSLDPSRNAYLRPAAEMVKRGYRGEPYGR